MATWLVCGLLIIVAGTGALASFPVTYIENLEETRASQRIVSGWEAEPGQFPHQISLRMINNVGGVSSCGGSIISPQWGITAAHCPGGRVSLVVRAGLVNLTTPLYIFETTKYYNHPLWNENLSVVQPHDIGLIDFDRSLSFNELVQPIRLQSSATKNRNYASDLTIASGWGRTWTNGPQPENLNWVYLIGDSNELCRQFYGGIVVDSTVCASYYNVTSQSTCQGDSGGPLTVVDNDGVVSMIGIASFVSSAGCHVGFPAGFIRPGHYHSWFEEVTNINFDWDFEVSTTPTPAPEYTTTQAPISTSTQGWETTPTQGPGTDPSVTPTPAPEYTTTQAPISTSTQGWETTPTQAPETDPSVTPTQVPEFTTTQAPEFSTTQIPGFTTTQGPILTDTPVPGFSTTQAPEFSTTQIPGLPTTQGPILTDTPVPEFSTTQAPEFSTTQIPGFPTTQGPILTDTPVPEFSTTQAPEFSTTQIPGLPTTQGPILTDTPLP